MKQYIIHDTRGESNFLTKVFGTQEEVDAYLKYFEYNDKDNFYIYKVDSLTIKKWVEVKNND